MSGRVMFYVQHLLGVGHLKRASLLAAAMVEAGLDVAVVLGGRDVAGIDFTGCARIQLPAVRAADESFKILIDDNGQPVDDAWREGRVARLLTEFAALRPDVLILELFPFGRLQFRFELLPLLEAARWPSRAPGSSPQCAMPWWPRPIRHATNAVSSWSANGSTMCSFTVIRSSIR